jgi:hypothetical protein
MRHWFVVHKTKKYRFLLKNTKNVIITEEEEKKSICRFKDYHRRSLDLILDPLFE